MRCLRSNRWIATQKLGRRIVPSFVEVIRRELQQQKQKLSSVVRCDMAISTLLKPSAALREGGLDCHANYLAYSSVKSVAYGEVVIGCILR
jgi:hypothetical protein